MPDEPTTQTPLDATLASAVRWVVPCAVLPLLFGIIAFVGWLICFWMFYPKAEIWFIMLGVGALVVGVLGFLAGSTILIARIYQARKLAGPDDRRRVIMHAGFLGTLLVANFPFAFFMTVMATGVFPATVVHVDNRTDMTIKDVTVHDPEPHAIGAALGGQSTALRFSPQGDTFYVTGTLDDREVELITFEDVEPLTVRARVVVKNPEDITSEWTTALPDAAR